METNQTMKTIMMTYPGFQALPKGIKMMLVASESFFFGEARSQQQTLAAPLHLLHALTFAPRFPALPNAWRN
jgi:hypothetical protein